MYVCFLVCDTLATSASSNHHRLPIFRAQSKQTEQTELGNHDAGGCLVCSRTKLQHVYKLLFFGSGRDQRLWAVGDTIISRGKGWHSVTFSVVPLNVRWNKTNLLLH